MRPVCLMGVGLTLASGPFGLATESIPWEQRIESLVQQGDLLEAERLAEAATREPASAAVGYGWLGRISMAQTRFAEASDRFRRARDLGAEVGEIAAPWSRALVRLGRRQEACNLLGDASSTDEANASLRYLTGSCYLKVGAARQALPHLEAAHRHGIAHSAAAMELARVRFQIGREDLAVEQLLAKTEQASDPPTLLAIGKMMFQFVLYRQAAMPLEKAWEAKPGWYEAGMYLAMTRYQLEDYQGSAEVLSALDIAAEPVEVRLLRGSTLARLGQLREARSELEDAIRMAPDRADGYLNLGLLHLDQGDREQALDVFAKAAQRDPRGAKIFYHVRSRQNCRSLTPPTGKTAGDGGQARYLSQFADSLQAGQQWGAALEVYLAALSIDSRLARPYGGIALICQELGTAEVGVKFALRGLGLYPTDDKLHYYLGSLYEYLGQPDAAIQSYEKALELSDARPTPARYWLRLGLAQLAAGESAEAELSFRVSLERDPDFAEAHYRLGRVHFRGGEFAEAERMFERAVHLDPSLDEAYYSWGLALVRNGKDDQGRAILDSYRKKLELRQDRGGGMR